jgi:flagellar protein FlbD
MIELTRLHNQKFVLNADLIESVEETPDTVIALQSGKKIMVKEPMEEVVRKVIDFKKQCSSFPHTDTPLPPPRG